MTPVTVPVLDRLIDGFPVTQSEPGLTRSQSVRILKAAVKRDLEWLLNTRRIPFEPPDSYRHLHRSVYVYGLPDFSNKVSQKDRIKLSRTIQTTVATFEPRLINVRISGIDLSAIRPPLLQFQIEGMLVMDPTPEHVSFDTVADLATGKYHVKDDPYAG